MKNICFVPLRPLDPSGCLSMRRERLFSTIRYLDAEPRIHASSHTSHDERSVKREVNMKLHNCHVHIVKSVTEMASARVPRVLPTIRADIKSLHGDQRQIGYKSRFLGSLIPSDPAMYANVPVTMTTSGIIMSCLPHPAALVQTWICTGMYAMMVMLLQRSMSSAF